MADALGSVIVVISALIIWLTTWEYRFYVDPILRFVSKFNLFGSSIKVVLYLY